ncbi:hypothetical protein RI129_006917 [Pyrocoelia pectoralis]|uniref:RAP domain-containing protein n=1 Tax=Pyrocoelia pectoralis TaxID=417401 RepID=A0AAN7ZI44_9COLE
MNFVFSRIFIPREIKCFIKCFRFTKFSYEKRSITMSHRAYLRNVSPALKGFVHDDTDDHTHLENLDDLTHLLHYKEMVQYQPVRNLLYAKSTDLLIVKLTNSESVQDVLNTVNDNLAVMDYTHITQAILVLWDLRKMYYFAQGSLSTEHCNSSFNNHPTFCSLMKLAEEKCDTFDAESFSCFLLYANKLDYQLDFNSPQFFSKIQNIINTNTSLRVTSRLLNVMRTGEPTMGSLLAVQPMVPTVLQELDKCENLEDLKLITMCLQHFQQNITREILQKYMGIVKRILAKSDIEPSVYRILLKIIHFLNIPKWGDRCTTLSSELFLYMKNHLHTLHVYDFCVLFEALYKTHEPGDLQTEMQRCCRLYLHSEDESNISKEMKLKLLSCTASFSSTVHRSDFEKVISEFLNYPLTIMSILDLLRIVTFVKSSNSALCERFWNKALEALKHNDTYKNLDILLKICQKYMNYSNDIHYRCMKFEKCTLNWLHDEFENGILSIIPSMLSLAAPFILAFDCRRNVLDAVLNKIMQNSQQFNHLDCLYISKGIRSFLNDILDNIVCNNILPVNEITQNNFLIKSCVYRKCFKQEIVNQIFLNYNVKEPLSSLSVRNMIIGLQTTGTLLPELIESLCNYVISYQDCMLGFNAEKVAHLCYHLGYTPNNSDQLFDAIGNIIIRDQERLSGLSFIHAAIALSFFNKLPTSWIKQIFNVSFLEKLDFELSMCYFKDKYPIRVRNSMMHLNRAVCLDYPQANVPWFHQKYIGQLQKDQTPMKSFPDIGQYLLHIVGDRKMLVVDCYTPYGYHIDFLLHLNDRGEFVKPNETATKIAMLLLKENAYTNAKVQLKGYQQLKKRHLEILGYQVAAVNLKDWNSLLYGAEKVKFLHKLIYPSNITDTVYSNFER